MRFTDRDSNVGGPFAGRGNLNFHSGLQHLIHATNQLHWRYITVTMQRLQENGPAKSDAASLVTEL